MGRGVGVTLRGRLERIETRRQRRRKAGADGVEPAAGMEEVAMKKRTQATLLLYHNLVALTDSSVGAGFRAEATSMWIVNDTSCESRCGAIAQ